MTAEAYLRELHSLRLLMALGGLLGYLYLSLTLMLIARKTATGSPWLAWIPLGNLYLMLVIARKPAWWLVLLCVPGVNIVFGILTWIGIAEARGKPWWMGILVFVVPLTPFMLAFLAFTN